MMAPLLVDGHACEFLVARLEVRGEVLKLEITADYGGNPFIKDEAEAREAVKTAVKLRLGEAVHALEDLAPMRLEKRSEWDADAPTAFAPTPDGQGHLLMTGLWEWQAAATPDAATDAVEVRLVLPEISGHDVLLWTRDEQLADRQARWMMLIGGESSPVMRLQQPADGDGNAGTGEGRGARAGAGAGESEAQCKGLLRLLPVAAVLGLLLAGWARWRRAHI